MSGYWLAVVPAIGVAFALWCGIVMWAPWQRPRHANHGLPRRWAEEVLGWTGELDPEMGSMILAEEDALAIERGFYEGPQTVVSQDEFDDIMARPLLEGWTDPLLDELRDGPTVFDEEVMPNHPQGNATGPVEQEPLLTGAGESEPCGVTAPPAPDFGFPGTDGSRPVVAGDSGWGSAGRSSIPAREPSQLPRTTGEIMRADLLADCCAFMGRQDAEVAVWLAAKLIGEWAAA